ncbi:hypothetical protein HK102_005102 [Quaeritorhiza haematococci]|nr:hypothetical protein HK102_005102 [Quaeritorhiza haematococci]
MARYERAPSENGYDQGRAPSRGVYFYVPVLTATVLGLSSLAFYIHVHLIRGVVTQLFSSAYWGLLTFLWTICIWIKFINLSQAVREANNKHAWGGVSGKYIGLLSPGGVTNRSLLFPSSIIAGFCCFLAFLSFCGYLAARIPDKPAALFVALSILNIAIFHRLHTQAASLNTSIASAIRRKSGAVLYTIYLILMSIASLIAVFIHIGAATQGIGLAIDNVRFGTPPGVMVKLQDFPYSIHLYCTGQKLNASDPIIWLEHGLGGQGLDFSWVMANVSSYARVCMYDRPGLGWSDTGALPRTTRQFTSELQSLLKSANITDDLFMVGHSLAGLNIRSAQRQLDRNRVVGVVLIQSTGAQHVRGGGGYLANLFLSWNILTRNLERRELPRSCLFVDRIVRTQPLASQSSLNNPIPPNDETLGSLPYGLVVVTNGLNATNLERLSTNRVVARSDTADHIGILHQEKEVQLVHDVVARVWANMLAAKRARGE